MKFSWLVVYPTFFQLGIVILPLICDSCNFLSVGDIYNLCLKKICHQFHLFQCQVATCQIASTGMVALSYVQKVADKVI